MRRFCPNCSAELLALDSCWNCNAIFGSNSDWQPTVLPAGAFKQRGSKTSAETEALEARIEKQLSTLLLIVGYGLLSAFLLFLFFVFPRGTSSGSVYGLFIFGPIVGLVIAILIATGHWLRRP